MKYLFSFLTLVLLLNCSANKTSIKYAQVEYEAGACFGFCPIYKISINSDRTAIFEAKRFNFSRDTSSSDENEGTFKGTIDQVQYDKLLSILDSLNPKNLNDFYGNKNVSDLPTSYLTIKYKDASIKKIQDYGKRGTPELQNLYQFFDDLRTNQAWTKIE
jgi:hypothetical protein